MEFISDRPFPVIRFHPTLEDDNQYFEVGLTGWLFGSFDDEMNGLTYWPPEKKPATHLIKMQAACDLTWDVHRIQVMKFYETYAQARAAVPKFIEDSTYETEAELPKRRTRIKRPSRFLDSDSEDEFPVRKQTKINIPPPPPIMLQRVSATTVSQKPISQKPVSQKPVSEKSLSQKPATQNSTSQQSKPVKGLGPSKEEQKKKLTEEVMERLKAARLAASAKMTSRKSPLKLTPVKVTQKTVSLESKSSQKTSEVSSPWKVTPMREGANDQSSQRSDSIVTIGSSPLGSPVGSPVRTPIKEEYFDPSEMLEIDLDNNASPLGSPVISPGCTQEGSPAREFSGKLKSRTEKSKEKEVESTCSSGSRRQLFRAESQTPVTLESIDLRLERLEVQSRETASKSDLILMNLGRLQRSLLPKEKRIVAPPNMPSLPLESEDDLNKFEAFLKKSDANLSAVCDYLSSFIRSSVPDPERKSTHSILSHMLYNCLAKRMNLEGGNEKIGFRGLQLYKVFLGTLQTAFPSSDLVVAENALQKWLKDAKARKQMPGTSSGGSSRPNSSGSSRTKSSGNSNRNHSTHRPSSHKSRRADLPDGA